MGEWLEDTLRSLQKVAYQQKEIIIVNDGSNDEKSIQKLYDLEKKYPISIIHKENAGLPSARNEGAKYAKGEFIAFLDSDDIVMPEYYHKAIKILTHYENISFVGCWINYFEGSEAKWVTWDPEPPYILVHNTINSSSIICKTDHFLSYGLNDSNMLYGMEDYECVVNMVKNGYRGVVLTDFLFEYRVRKDSMSRQFNANCQLFLYKILSHKHKDFYSAYAYEIFNIVNSNGPSYLYENPTIEIGMEELKYKSNIFNSAEIPWELKEILKKFWKNKFFRTLAKIFFKLKLQKLFK
jgi:glycosyltransferase involved in cell wall biosynthesis